MDVRYLPDIAEIEVVNDIGFSTCYPIDSLIQIYVNERELGTETEYMTDDGSRHFVFYPEGRLINWWEDE